MKKILLTFLLSICLLLPITGSAMSVPISKASPISGGINRNSAMNIPEVRFGQLLTGCANKNDGEWFRIEAPSSGNLSIYVNSLETENNTPGMIYFRIYTNGSDWSMDSHYVNYKEDMTCVYPVNEGEVYYIHVSSMTVERNMGVSVNYLFSLCFDGYHMASDKSEITRNASCSRPGEITTFCMLCSHPAIVTEIPQLAHTPGEWSLMSAATCTTPGLNAQTCTVCGEIVNSTEIPATGHGATETIITSESTCMQAGKSEERCLICGATVSVSHIPVSSEHVMSTMRIVREPTCTSNGRGEQRCSVCQKLLSEETTTALGHSYSDWSVTIEATKEHEGERARYCFYCGHTERERIEKLPKAFGIF